MGRFSKLPYLGMKLSHWPKLHICLLSFYTRRSNWRLFSLHGQWFLRYWQIFKIAIIGHETWPLAKVPKAAHGIFFYPRGSKLSLFSLYGQRFPKYGPIFKLATFGNETWPKCQQWHIHVLSVSTAGGGGGGQN